MLIVNVEFAWLALTNGTSTNTRKEQWNRRSVDFGVSKTPVQVRDLRRVS